jgi:hypothetical protein
MLYALLSGQALIVSSGDEEKTLPFGAEFRSIIIPKSRAGLVEKNSTISL